MLRRTVARTILLLLVAICIISYTAISSALYQTTVKRIELETIYRTLHMVPITVVERGGVDLYNYTVRIELNSTNFDGWDIVADDLSDVYFLDESGEPLYYWIEYANKTEKKAVIWVKIPHLPANSKTTIYMFYGGPNPYKAYNDPDKVFIFYDDFTYKDEGKWNWNSYWSVENGYLYRTTRYYFGKVLWTAHDLGIKVSRTTGIVIETCARVLDSVWRIVIAWDTDMSGTNMLGSFAYVITGDGAYDRWVWFDIYTAWKEWGEPSARQWNLYQVVIFDGEQKFLVNGVEYSRFNGNIQYIARIGVESYGRSQWDWIRVRPYTEPEPETVVGKPVEIFAVLLPPKTITYQHEIVYAPPAAKFTYSFTATNTSTANYEVQGYSWKVYVEPYSRRGTHHKNTAKLVATISIDLPYTRTSVEKVALYARATGTGSFRQLWVKVLDDQGNVVAELKNTTIDKEWTEITIYVGKRMSRLSLWINCTVSSTATEAEEIAVRDVRVYVKYTADIKAYALVVQKPDIPVLAHVKVNLSSSEIAARSTILLKVADKLHFDNTTYPVKPMLLGYEEVNGSRYAVYVIDKAFDTGVFMFNFSLPNTLWGMTVKSKGVDIDTCLVNETIELYLPEPAAIAIRELGTLIKNTAKLYTRFDKPGVYTITGIILEPSKLKIGFKTITLKVVYGRLNIELVDLDNRTLDYEHTTILLIDSTGKTVRIATVQGKTTVEGLASGNYTIKILFANTTLAEKQVELTIHTHNTTVRVKIPAKRLAPDYRNMEKHVIVVNGKLVDLVDAKPEFRYSQINISLESFGNFKLYIYYGGKTPSKVAVRGNASSIRYSWNGEYLVIEGTAHNTTTISIVDLYRVRIELRDKLGRPLPYNPAITVNGTIFEGSSVEVYLCPGHYMVQVPARVSNFKFAHYSDGHTNNTKMVTVVDADVTVQAMYKIPTKIVDVKGYKIFVLWHMIPKFHSWDKDKVEIYIEGYLKDAYGEGVPQRTVVIDIFNKRTGQTITVTAKTDATGHFKTQPIQLPKDAEYIAHIVFGGDDIYLASEKTAKLQLEQLPTSPPTPVEIVRQAITPAIAAATTTYILLAVLKTLRHTVEDTSRKFVKRRRP